MKAHFALPLFLIAFTLVACGPDWSVGPDDGGRGGSGMSRRYHYYYGVDCRYDSFGPYDCTDTYTLSPSMNVDLRITRDGYATLCVDDECSYYDPDEYYDGYDHGDHYYEFSDYDTRMIVYTDGSELVYVDNYDGMAYYYYYDYYR
ncbi:MAG: hypothetical protein J6W51_00905 [Fibrobacter sp.]|nr:hypothetical protein [Fibrobacter sp.]MBP5767665.1 hypothetical protein [Fibrobacter sp.]